MAECTCGWTGQDMDTHASWCPAGGSAPMLSDKELADKLTDAEVRQRVGEAKNARALLWSQVTDRDVFLCGAKWMLEQIVAGKVRTASGVTACPNWPTCSSCLGCTPTHCADPAAGVAEVVAPRMSDAEIDKIWRDTPAQGDPTGKLFYRYFARAVLAADGVEASDGDTPSTRENHER